MAPVDASQVDPVQLRRATPEDVAAAGRVTVAAYAPFLDGPHDPYAARLADAGTRAREAELWVALAAPDPGEPGETGEPGEPGAPAVLGTMTWCPEGSRWRERAAPDEGELRMLAVAPSAQGRGVGLALARTALERARAEGRAAVVLSSLPGMSAAHRLYARLGFTRTPERDWAPVPGVELISFRKDLR